MKKIPVTILFFAVLWLGMLAFILLPKEEVSSDENRTLAKFPEVSAHSILNNSFAKDIESYVNDHAPFRSQLVRLKNTAGQLMGNSENNEVIFGAHGRLYRRMYVDDSCIGKNVKAVNNLVGMILPGARNVYFALVPSAAQIYSKDLPTGCQVPDEAALIQDIYESVDDTVFTIDTLTPLAEAARKNEANLYFKTDHHYTVYGAAVAGNAVLEQLLGVYDSSYGEHIRTMDGFYGSYFRRTPTYTVKSEKMDYLEYDNLTMSIGDTVYDNLVDDSKKELADKYGMLLHGNNALLTIHNSKGKKGTRLIVCKDSYFNILAPMIANQYEEIDIIDLRYFTDSFPEYIREHEGDILLYFSLYNFDTENSIQYMSID